MTKEQIYDAQIDPLLTAIDLICKQHKIAYVSCFALEDNYDGDGKMLGATGGNLGAECSPPAGFQDAWKHFCDVSYDEFCKTSESK